MLCDAEKTFILHGVQDDFRVDGRTRNQYRPMELELNLGDNAFGSSRLRLANTDVIVTVKLEIDVPYPDNPKSGKLEFFVDCSANATPAFEGRGGEELAIELANSLSAAYRSSQALDLSKLCILKGRKCWKVYIDVLILECGGNLYDAVSIAVKAALCNTKIPKIAGVHLDGDKVNVDISENIYDCIALDVSRAPVIVTVSRIGEYCVVDASDAEEQCSIASIVLAYSQGRFTMVFKSGAGSLYPETLIDTLKFGKDVALELDTNLLKLMKKPKENQDIGFLM